MSLGGGVFLEAEFSAPWCITARVTAADCAPFVPPPKHVIASHYVTHGHLFVGVEGQPTIEAAAGDVILVPRNDTHWVGSAPSMRPARTGKLIQPARDGGLSKIVYGGGGDRTQILCGFLGTSTANSPILDLMPAVLALGLEEGSAKWIESSFRFAAQQLVAGQVSRPATLGKLAELLFLEAVRRYVDSTSAGAEGWLSGLGDPVVGRALALMHSRMRDPWTTEDLAREAGLSRSAFASRFTGMIGQPPMRYLASCRLRYAADRLSGTRDSVARIAYDAGYESEAAFTRAFKRAYALPPIGWRKRHHRDAR